MIAPLLSDRALPGLNALFDEPAMAGMVAGALREGDAHAPAITRLRPVYARYKPGTSCLVRYELAYRDQSGTEQTLPAQIKIFADNRGERRAANRKLGALREQADEHTPLPFTRAAYLSVIQGLLQVFPVDYDLRPLARVASPRIVSGWLREAMPGSPDLTVSGEPALIRYKPERKALFRYDLAGGPTGQVYGKISSDGRADLIAAKTHLLIDAGLPTPPVLACRPEEGFIVHEAAPGLQLASLRAAPDYPALMPELAGLMGQLHRIALPGLPGHRLADEAALLRQTAAWLAAIAPHLADRLERLTGQLQARLGQIDDRLVTSHGDFYDDQALVTAAGMTLIDLDELCRSHPLHDAGNMLAHLTAARHAGQEPGAARDAFLRAALAHGRFTDRDIAGFEAAALLKLAPGPFRRLEPDWPAGIERIVALAEQALAPHAAAPSPHRLTDPALPTIATLQNRESMSRHLGLALGEPALTVTAIEPVRHKPGRRVIFRYDLATSRGRETCFGKSFASERGPRVAALTRTIGEAQAFGPETALPDLMAYLPDLRLVVQRAVPGGPVDAALLAGDTTLAGQIARAITTFHASGLDLGRSHGLDKELSPLPLRACQISTSCLALARLSSSCLESIEEQRWSGWAWRAQPVHRDFYHAQLLLSGDRLAVLDLDDAAMAEPAVDIANFAAHLILLGAQHPAHSLNVRRVQAAFLDQAHRLDRGLDPALVRFLTASTLLRLGGIHIDRVDGHRIGRTLLESCALLLGLTGRDGGARRRTAIEPERPALMEGVEWIRQSSGSPHPVISSPLARNPPAKPIRRRRIVLLRDDVRRTGLRRRRPQQDEGVEIRSTSHG